MTTDSRSAVALPIPASARGTSTVLPLVGSLLASLLVLSAAAQASDLQALQQRWAEATYQTKSDDDREDALARLADEARLASDDDPTNVDLLIWKGIILGSLAGEKGGFGALGLAREARTALEKAIELDPGALDGSAYATLGTLYHKVPGWPIGFGSDKKAREFLERALEFNPSGIDSNYFMGEFLANEGEYLAARRYLRTAQNAPDRASRPLADEGRRREVADLLAKVESHL